jgi:hypothetical protein
MWFNLHSISATKIVARFEFARVRIKISNGLGAKLELSIRKTEF